MEEAGSGETTVHDWYEARDLAGEDYHVGYYRRVSLRNAETRVSVYTGGWTNIAPPGTIIPMNAPAGPVLIEVVVSAYDSLNQRPIPPEEITVRGKQLDEDGTARFILPAHAVEDITPEFQLSGFGPQQTFAEHIKFNILAKAAHPKVWFSAQSGKVHRGFDPASPNDWSSDAYTSICTNATKSIVEAFVDPPEMASHVKLVVVQTNTPAFITASPTLLNNGGGGTPINLTAGSVPGTYTVEARTTYSNTRLATLHVKAMPLRVVNFGIFAIEDTNSLATTGVTIPDQSALESALNELGEQACLKFQLEPATERLHHYAYDLNGDGLAQRNETEIIPESHLSDYSRFPGRFRVFVFKKSGVPYPHFDSFFVRGILMEVVDACVAFQVDIGGDIPRVILHEFGHLVGLSTAQLLDPQGHDMDAATWPNGEASVIRSGAPVLNATGDAFSLPNSGRWLRHGDWTKLNDGADEYK
ncbi:MAG: hypothetical protein ISQ14_08645 [Verrucomicrobiae bacterium]|nr:hypothetical protein [Verrucomicrobiae bacterium]